MCMCEKSGSGEAGREREGRVWRGLIEGQAGRVGGGDATTAVY